ncbi:hypothetical protein CXG81DRAFT_25460 [Caulochytrium protostelioides]|uniref:GH18 domain-containing protein n=1 Tax=Caulochytrium protostelioides TaxID=1555241 RepID=A0A4P9X9C6_9FUNG|nr:hypothetical protein CXG81DRAFT_25460 [Caulochytrium protostelioides]|eukprot:RKP01895.1 hypothetical protein CXG81DRAFT_25460 [Caulochytrium protostelioides]
MGLALLVSHASAGIDVGYSMGSSAGTSNLANICGKPGAPTFLNLSFLQSYDSQQVAWSFNSQGCELDHKSTVASLSSACKTLREQVTACESSGTHIIVSIGGAADGGKGQKITGSGGKELAQSMSKALMTTQLLGPIRGFDLDFEQLCVMDNPTVKEFMKELRVQLGPSNYLTAAPQCPTSYLHVYFGPAGIGNLYRGLFDIMNVQFYNNKGCNLVPVEDEQSGFVSNLQEWDQLCDAYGCKVTIGTFPDDPKLNYDETAVMKSVTEGLKGTKNVIGVMAWTQEGVASRSGFSSLYKKIAAATQFTSDDYSTFPLFKPDGPQPTGYGQSPAAPAPSNSGSSPAAPAPSTPATTPAAAAPGPEVTSSTMPAPGTTTVLGASSTLGASDIASSTTTSPTPAATAPYTGTGHAGTTGETYGTKGSQKNPDKLKRRCKKWKNRPSARK